MRKYVFLVMLFILVLSPKVALAGDPLARMLYADKVEEYKKDQDAVIVGQLIEDQGDLFKVKVLKVISGKVSSDLILVSDDFNYGWDKATPSVNDFAVFSLKRTGNFYRKAWGIFKASSGDYKTLKLKSVNSPTPGLIGDLAAIQWYVNSGGKEKDFYFSGGTAYVRRPNGQSVQINPVPASGRDAEVYDSAVAEIQNSPSVGDNTWSSLSRYVFVMIVFLIGIGGTAVFVKFRRGKVK
jgi:hypothetical protein